MTTIDEVGTRSFHVAIAAASAALLMGIALVTLPVADKPWPERSWFLAVYLISVFLLEGLTALLLALQSMGCTRHRALAWLSGAYVFTAVIALVQLLTFPGIVSPAGAADATRTALWLWVFWHGGFPCFVLGAMAARARREARQAAGVEPPHALDLFPLAIAFLAALGAALVSMEYWDYLPAWIENHDYRQFRDSPVAAAVAMLNLFTLWAMIYVTRLRALLHLWLAVVLLAFNLDVVLSLVAGARYSAGWYVARGLSVASAGGLMVALLIQHYWLHRNAEIRAAFHEEEARHDPLTGLFNRRHLMSELAEELGRARRYRHPLSLLLVDLDHFKRINDQHGHVAGDQCLKALAVSLNERGHRQGDFAARYGGEEFVVVLPETGEEGALEVAEEVRQRVELLHARGTAPCPMTVSIGVAIALSSPPTVEQLLADADARLYQAKREGRNRVVGPMGPPGPSRLESAIG